MTQAEIAAAESLLHERGFPADEATVREVLADVRRARDLDAEDR